MFTQDPFEAILSAGDVLGILLEGDSKYFVYSFTYVEKQSYNLGIQYTTTNHSLKSSQ